MPGSCIQLVIVPQGNALHPPTCKTLHAHVLHPSIKTKGLYHVPGVALPSQLPWSWWDDFKLPCWRDQGNLKPCPGIEHFRDSKHRLAFSLYQICILKLILKEKGINLP
jgi:hypothetical protein